jgi:ribosomal protein S18 acetylase RimI-like enzyme
MGVHLVGVIADFRGRGIARALMQYIINLSIALDGKYLMLQASAAGESLYRELGFMKQFTIKNYQRALKNNKVNYQ